MSAKPGVQIEIPGLGRLDIHKIVSDYSGSLSVGGKLTAGVRERLLELETFVDIDILTSDTFGTVRSELANLPLHIEVLQDKDHHLQKQRYVATHCEPAHVVAFGNGNNDRLMLQAVRDAGGLAVCIENGEGCAVTALMNASLLIHGAAAALDLLLDPNRVKAGLRF